MTRWQRIARETVGADYAQKYAERFRAMAARGDDIHGEATFVTGLVEPPARVLDAGCGTGRVAIELDRRGYDTVGLDVDPTLLERARAKAPALTWQEADLASLPADLTPGPFAAAVLAGNVMIFVARGSEGAVLANLALRLAPGGLVVAGFQLSGRLPLPEYDAAATGAGLALRARWSTWDRAPFTEGDGYAVSVHELVSNR